MISALLDEKSKFIPYRNTKVTRLLQGKLLKFFSELKEADMILMSDLMIIVKINDYNNFFSMTNCNHGMKFHLEDYCQAVSFQNYEIQSWW